MEQEKWPGTGGARAPRLLPACLVPRRGGGVATEGCVLLAVFWVFFQRTKTNFSSKGAIFSRKDEAVCNLAGVAQDGEGQGGDKLPTPLPRRVPLATRPHRLSKSWGSRRPSDGLWNPSEWPRRGGVSPEQGTFSVGASIPLQQKKDLPPSGFYWCWGGCWYPAGHRGGMWSSPRPGG